MDNSLRKLEANLEDLIPRGLSDQGRVDCENLIDRLASKDLTERNVVAFAPAASSWKGAAAAAAIILGVGLGSGWFLGQKASAPSVVESLPDHSANSLSQAYNATFEKAGSFGSISIHNDKGEKVKVEELASAGGEPEVGFRDEDGKFIKLRFKEN